MASSLRHSAENSDNHREKTWQDIAERVTKEQDSEKLTQLTHELLDALDETTKQRRPRPQPVSKGHGKRLS